MTRREADGREDGPPDAPESVAPATEAEPATPPRGRDPAPGRRLRGRLDLGLATLFFAATVAMVNYLGARHYERWDLTEARLFTLSERTLAELSSLDRAVTIYLFMSQGEANFPEVRDLLRRYEAETDRLVVEHVDPDRDPGRFRVLAARYGVGAQATEAGLAADTAAVVVSGDQRWSIRGDDLVSVDFESFDDQSGPKLDVKAEQSFTGAIVQVTSGRSTRVCLSKGHGEWATDGPPEQSIASLADELRRENIELEDVVLREVDAVPGDCDAFFVLGPSRPFTDDEARKLDAFLESGRGVLLALEPQVENDRVLPTGLEDMLRGRGIDLDPTLVLELDGQRLLPPPSPAGPFLAADFGEHPVVAPLARIGGVVAVSVARTVRPRPGGNAEVLARTSEAAFAARSLGRLEGATALEAESDDLEGPVPLAVALTLPEPASPPETPENARGDDVDDARAGRLVVVGDVDWLADDLLGARQLLNYDLALTTAGWLTEREALVAIPPKQVDAVPLTLTEADLTGPFGLATRVLVMIPAAFMLLGLSSWWWRRG
jgi:hypothetical protein